MNEAVTRGEPKQLKQQLEQPVQLEQLGRAERLHLTWALTWPCMVLSLVYCSFYSLMSLRLSELQLGSIGWVVGIIKLFLLGTWAVRRTVRLDFPGFHLVVVR